MASYGRNIMNNDDYMMNNKRNSNMNINDHNPIKSKNLNDNYINKDNNNEN